MEDMISGMVPQQNEEGEGHVRRAQQDVSELRANCARESAARTSTKTPVYDLYAVVNHCQNPDSTLTARTWPT
jgi:hypothetical protein